MKVEVHSVIRSELRIAPIAQANERVRILGFPAEAYSIIYSAEGVSRTFGAFGDPDKTVESHKNTLSQLIRACKLGCFQYFYSCILFLPRYPRPVEIHGSSLA